MQNQEEVALFIDFENIRYSMIKLYGREPDPTEWIQKARKYGLISVAKAYADFSRHPEGYRARLDVAGIEAEQYPVKEVGDNRVQSSADMHMVIDIIETALDRPMVTTFVLMTGDRDFIRIVARLRNRHGKRVVIAGVPGSVSSDLVEAAGMEDPIEVPQASEILDKRVIARILAYEESLHSGFLPTFRSMVRWLQHYVNHQIIDPLQVEAKLTDFVRRGILTRRQEVSSEGKELTTTFLQRDHPLVAEVIAEQRAAQAASSEREEQRRAEQELDQVSA